MELDDVFDRRRLQDLYTTLPTRDGTPYDHTPPVIPHNHLSHAPRNEHPLPHGHHLAFFHPRIAEPLLRPDGTDSTFCPPEPFVRRMWAGGRMEWLIPMKIGMEARASNEIAAVEKKGFGAEGKDKAPMVFVTQRIEMKDCGETAKSTDPYIVEERTHVYLPLGFETRRAVRKHEVPSKSDFSFTYTPTLTTLFRFSALTFNAHQIHLDKDYAQKSEGYPERLVHAPLTALMMLETLAFHKPDIRMKSFEYRAVNPIIINRPCTIKGVWSGTDTARLWAEDPDGVVGMTGSVVFTSQ
ncbi:unnamed protein product [Peniophora sp. CBMAI 1063]|nr:unnamed protein product [Peniophora sp. CBMAI 1063]